MEAICIERNINGKEEGSMFVETIIQTVVAKTQQLLQEKQRVLVAIDGRCASGKTTLAQALQERLNCDVIHMDSFFLRPEQRTKERYEMPGGNVDYERLQIEVMEPLKKGHSFCYRPFLCSTQELGEPIAVKETNVILLEGSYSCHPLLWDQTDLHIFLTVDATEQLRRLEKRDASKLRAFQEKWIPLEEHYFASYEIEEKCDLSFAVEIEKGYGKA